MAFHIITDKRNTAKFDVVFLDVTLPPYKEQNLESGEDLARLVKNHLPTAKIVMLTSHVESLVLYKILKDCNPNGLLVKSDILPEEFLKAFDEIVRGENYYSPTVTQQKQDLILSPKMLDSYNMQIILLLSQGIKTKNLQDYINLSQSAIEKRKSIIKIFFGIERGTDEDILREARNLGLI
jgi:DNA-binding NarL/FixJ family response regulator